MGLELVRERHDKAALAIMAHINAAYLFFPESTTRRFGPLRNVDLLLDAVSVEGSSGVMKGECESSKSSSGS